MIHGCVRTGRANVVPFAVGAWIGGAYWFTSSTSFANPAVTIARTLSDTFAGIAPVVGADVHRHAARRRRRSRFGLIRFFYPHATDASEAPDDRPPDPRSCSSACTTPAAPRWPPRCSPTTPATGSSSAPPAPRPPTTSTRPSSRPWPRSASTCAAAGAHPKKLDDAAVQASDVVITMGCGDACPLYPGKRYEDWELDDPAGQGVDAVRPIRDEIDAPGAGADRLAGASEPVSG